MLASKVTPRFWALLLGGKVNFSEPSVEIIIAGLPALLPPNNRTSVLFALNDKKLGVVRIGVKINMFSHPTNGNVHERDKYRTQC